MDNNFQQLIRQHYHSTWLQHPVPHSTSGHHQPNAHHSILSRTISSHRSSDTGPITEIGDREGISSASKGYSRLLQFDVRHSKEERGRSSSLQPQTIKPISEGPSLQDGDYQGSITHDQSRRLLSVNRFIRCISTYRSSPGIETILTSEMERSGIPILYNRLWSGFESICLHQSLQAYLGALPLNWYQDFFLLGRLDLNRRIQATREDSGSSGGFSITGPWLANQLQEIGSRPHSTVGTSRLCVEYPVDDSPTTCKQTERYSSFDQTGHKQTSSSISKDHTQFDNADTSSDLFNLPSSTLHSPPVVLQESNSEIRSGLGSSSISRSSESEGAAMVVRQHSPVEWSFDTSVDSQPNNVCGRQQHGMGLLMEPSSGSRVLDSRGSSSVSPQDFSSSTELHSLDQDRQYHQPLLHQQTRRNPLSSSTGTSYGSMDMVSPEQGYDPGTAYSRNTEHNRGLRVSQTILQEPMEDHTTDISTDTSELGSFLHRSLRRQDNEIVTKLRVMDAGPRRSLYGCAIHPMELISESLRKSPLESHLSSIEQDQTGTASLGDSGGAVLAERSVFPFPPTVGSLTAMDVTATSGGNNISQDSPSSATTELDALRVAIIRQQLVKQDLSEQAVADLLTQKLAPTGTNRGYRKNQLRFLKWAIQNNISCTSFTPGELVNFLADMRRTHNLQASTLSTLRTAVTHLHDDSTIIRESSLINSYIDSMTKQAPPVSIHRPAIDVTPALGFARTIPSRTTTPIKTLQQKLAFLLAMVAFLRPSDLARIPFTSCPITDDGCLSFQAVAPKETRRKRRIIKPCKVHPHATDTELCPVQCFKALRDHPNLASRPPGSKLLVKSHLIHQPLSSSTISSWLHRNFIALCTSEPNVSIRSLASSRAFDLGVARDSIVTLGNWTSSSTFENHYQRNQMAQIDFTSTILSDSVDQFYDATEVFSLD